MDLEAAREVVSGMGWLSQQPAGFRNELLCRTVLKVLQKG